MVDLGRIAGVFGHVLELDQELLHAALAERLVGDELAEEEEVIQVLPLLRPDRFDTTVELLSECRKTW